jgi:hypothetical protein
MKSKSPFSAYKYNMTGAYANPETVIQPILGAEVAKSVIGAAEKLGSQLITKESAKQAKSEKSFSDLAKSSQEELNKIKSSKVGGESMFGTDFSSKGMVNSGNQIGENSLVKNKENPFTAFQMKGSPVNHNDQQEVSDLQEFKNIMKQPGGLAANATKFFKSRNAAKSAVGSIAGPQPQSSAISIAGLSLSGGSATPIGQKPTGSTPSGAGLFGAAAQAVSADAASQELLPPPNQVAESGSYAGTGDRMLEMDSNPVGNQSIGRDTDIASRLFGSGQRASMLAMKGTPLYDKGHGAKQAHTHPSKTTTKMKPDGEYPGAKYVKGDYVDQDDLLDKTDLDVHISTLVKSDKKGTFIKEKPDSGPGSDISTAKGFGKKIRLNNMARSTYTPNEGDQLDPHKFLFQKTPKKSK